MGAVLLYDGECGLCARSVRFVLRHERRKTLRFATLQGSFGLSVRSRHPTLQGQDTVAWFEPAGEGRPERVLTRSEAALAVLRYLGGPWRLAAALAIVPRAWRDAAYSLVARHRRRWFGGPESCALPPPHERHRFLT